MAQCKSSLYKKVFQQDVKSSQVTKSKSRQILQHFEYFEKAKLPSRLSTKRYLKPRDPKTWLLL